MGDINQHVLVGCLRDGCVCDPTFGKCTRCYAADTIQALQAEVERLKGVLGPVLEIAERNEPGLATQAARSALEAKP